MTLRATTWKWLLCCLLAACGSEAETSAVPDAGAGVDLLADVQDDVALPEEVTVLSDSMATDVGPIAVPTACWETACAPQLSACTAEPRCLALAHCAELAMAGKADLAGCKTAAGASAVATWTDLTTCGAAACPDLFSASCEEQCGKPAAVGAPCACDGQCEQYGDCCYDYGAQCKDEPVGPKNTTCKDSCGTFFGGESCNCDAECVGYNDCCDDYQQVCLAADTTDTGSNDAVDPAEDATTASDTGTAD